MVLDYRGILTAELNVYIHMLCLCSFYVHINSNIALGDLEGIYQQLLAENIIEQKT